VNTAPDAFNCCASIKLKQDAIEYITKKLKKPASEDRALCIRTISI
jgi:hypothetical protein